MPALEHAQDRDVSHRTQPREGSVRPWAIDIFSHLTLTWLGISSEEDFRSQPHSLSHGSPGFSLQKYIIP